LEKNLPAEELIGNIITEIDNQAVNNIRDVQRIMAKRSQAEPIVVTFVDKNGQKQRLVWR
ncbi:MAG: serine protease, partial [Salegentibacter sp.]